VNQRALEDKDFRGKKRKYCQDAALDGLSAHLIMTITRKTQDRTKSIWILQVFSVSLLDKMLIRELLNKKQFQRTEYIKTEYL